MNIHVQRTVLSSPLVKELEANGREFDIIDDLSEVPDEKSEIILRNKHDLYCHPCPATKIYRCCNYYTTDVMEGCPFDCTYCILQAYLGHRNIQVSADIGSIEDAIKAMIHADEKRRLGTGELSDSLALDHIFPFSKIITPLINDQDVLQFEFKTKSVNIRNLLNLNPKNVVVSWSLNPQAMVDKYEKGAAFVSERIAAAKTCAEAGYKVGFHFDPIIYYDGYQADYAALIDELVANVPEQAVAYISISTFRAPATLVDKMRGRNDHYGILQGDFIRAIDGKMRYFRVVREEMLKNIYYALRHHWSKAFIYLCMEHETMWKELFGFDPGERTEFEQLFPNMRRGL